MALSLRNRKSSMSTTAFTPPTGIEDTAVRGRTVALLREKGVRLPTFRELAEPETQPQDIVAKLSGIGPDEAHPLNLYRVNWFNDAKRTGRVATPVHAGLAHFATLRSPSTSAWW